MLSVLELAVFPLRSESKSSLSPRYWANEGTRSKLVACMFSKVSGLCSFVLVSLDDDDDDDDDNEAPA